MLGFLKGDPVKKLKKAYQAKLTEAMQAQRNGDIRRYSELTEEAEALLAQVQAAESAS